MNQPDPFAKAVESALDLLLFGLRRLWRSLFPRRPPRGAPVVTPRSLRFVQGSEERASRRTKDTLRAIEGMPMLS